MKRDNMKILLMRELHGTLEMLLTSQCHTKSLEWHYQRFKALHDMMSGLKEGVKPVLTDHYLAIVKEEHGDNDLLYSAHVITADIKNMILQGAEKVSYDKRVLIEELGIISGTTTSVVKYFYYKNLPYSLEYIPTFNKCLLRVHNSVEYIDMGLLDMKGLDPYELESELKEKVKNINFVYDETKFINGICNNSSLYSHSMTGNDWEKVGMEQHGPFLYAFGEKIEYGNPDSSERVRRVYDNLLERGANICGHRLAQQYFEMLSVLNGYYSI